jgi:bifunctional non-homologous end joining protein LigD
VKFDGFHVLAHVNGHHCQLVSRNGHQFKSWPYLAEEIAHAVRAHSAGAGRRDRLLGSGRMQPLSRSAVPARVALLDALAIDGEDLRELPLVERKRRLARIMPRIESRLMLLAPIHAHGTRLYELACERDLEGIVAKWARGSYQCDGRGTCDRAIASIPIDSRRVGCDPPTSWRQGRPQTPACFT